MSNPSPGVMTAVLAYRVDQGSERRVIDSLNGIANQARPVQAEFAKTVAIADHLKVNIEQLDRNRRLAQIGADMALAAQQGKGLDIAVAGAVRRLEQMDATKDDIDAVTRGFRQATNEAERFNAATSVGGIGGVAGSAAQQTARGAAIARAGNELRMLPSIQTGLGFGTDAIANIIRLTGALTTIAGSFTTLLAVAAPVAAVIGGIALITAENTRRQEEEKKAREEAADAASQQIELLKEERQVREQIRGLIGQGDPAAVQARLAVTQGVRDADEAERQRLIAQQENLVRTRFLPEAIRAGDNLSGVVDPGVREDAIAQRLAELQENDPEFQARAERIAELIGSIQGLDSEIAQLNALASPGAGIIAGLNAPLAQSEQQRRVEGLSSRQLRSGLDTFGDDIELLGNKLVGTDLEIRQARAEGNKELEVALRIEQINTQAQIDRTRSLQAMYQAQLAATEAEERRRASIERQIDLIDQQIARDVERGQILRTGTVDSIDQRTAALQDEYRATMDAIPGLQELANTSDEARERLVAAQQRLSEINLELGQLVSIRPDVALRQFNEETTKLSNQIAQITAQSEQRIADLQAALPDKEAKIREEGNERLLDISEKYNVDRVKAERDLQRELDKLNAKIGQAVQDRNVVQFDQLKTEKEQEKQAADDRQNEREDEYNREIKQLAENIDKRLKAERDGLDKSVALERQRAQREIDQRTAAANIILGQLNQAANSEITIRNATNSTVVQGLLNLYNFAQRLFGGAPPNVVAPNVVQIPQTGNPYLDYRNYQITQGVQFRADGGDVLPYRDYIVGENGPELLRIPMSGHVYTPDQYRRMDEHTAYQMGRNGGFRGGVPPVVINGYGLNRKQVVALVDDGLRQYDSGIDDGEAAGY